MFVCLGYYILICSLWVCVGMYGCACDTEEVRGKLAGVYSPPLLCRSQESSSGGQAWQQVP